jgi:accessory gene regulator protein AgrB
MMLFVKRYHGIYGLLRNLSFGNYVRIVCLILSQRSHIIIIFTTTLIRLNGYIDAFYGKYIMLIAYVLVPAGTPDQKTTDQSGFWDNRH